MTIFQFYHLKVEMSLLSMRVLIVLQLFLSMEPLVPSALCFSILKTVVGLNFPFDFFSSFSPSFWNSEERYRSKTQVIIFNSFCKHA